MTTQQEPSHEWLTLLMSSGECPDIEVLFQWHDGALSEREEGPLGRHVESCPRCQTELALLAEFEAGEVLPHERADVAYISTKTDEVRTRKLKLARRHTSRLESPPKVHQIPGWLSTVSWRAMAGLAAALLVAVLYLNLPLSVQPVQVNSGDPATLRSGRLELIAPLGEIPSPRTHFQWHTVSGATHYSLQLEEIDGTVLWRAETDLTSLEIPEQIGSLLLPGKRVLWSVKARDAEGSLLAESQRQPVMVRRGGEF